MKNDLLIITPTRGRPQNIRDLIKAFDETETKARFLIVLDDDDEKLGHYLEIECDSLVLPREGKGMAKPLNHAAWINRNNFKNFAFLGDDHRPRTKHWDCLFVDALDELGTGLVYGDDLLQGKNLPTAVAMTSDIVRNLCGMVPPGMIHLYLDNFWLKLGQDLNAIRYMPEVILEHLHPVAGKAGWDANYRAVNAEEVYTADAVAYKNYIQSPAYEKLLKTLKESNRTDWSAIASAHQEWKDSGNAKPQGWWSI